MSGFSRYFTQPLSQRIWDEGTHWANVAGSPIIDDGAGFPLYYAALSACQGDG